MPDLTTRASLAAMDSVLFAALDFLVGAIAEYYAMLSKTTVHHFAGTNVALGTAAGKLFRVGCVSILHQQDVMLIGGFPMQCHDRYRPRRFGSSQLR